MSKQKNREQLRSWVHYAKEQGFSYVIIVEDSSDGLTFPVNCTGVKDCIDQLKHYQDLEEFFNVLEVYYTRANIAKQLDTEKAWNTPGKSAR